MAKLTRQLSGITGEYYVAAEISRRGYVAAITLRNTDGIDMVVSNTKGDKLLSVQVKTTQHKRKWILSEKVECNHSANKYFIFVRIWSDLSLQPEYIIVNSVNLAKNVYEGHRRWLQEPGKNGRERIDSKSRSFDPESFDENELISWETLIERIEENPEERCTRDADNAPNGN